MYFWPLIFAITLQAEELKHLPEPSGFQEIPGFKLASDELQILLIKDYLTNIHVPVKEIKKLDNKSAKGIFHLAIFDVTTEKKARIIVKVTETKDRDCQEVRDLWEVSLTDFSDNTVKEKFNKKQDKKKKYFWNAFKSLKHAPDFEFPKMLHWAMNRDICVAVMEHANAEPILYAVLSDDAKLAAKVTRRLGQMTAALHFREAPLDLVDLSKAPIWSHGDLHRFNILGETNAKRLFLIDYADVKKSPSWEASQAWADLEQVTGLRWGMHKFEEEIRHYQDFFIKKTDEHPLFPGTTREGRLRWLAQRLNGGIEDTPTDPAQYALIQDQLSGKNAIKDAVPEIVPKLTPFRASWRYLNERVAQLEPFEKGYLEMTPKGVRTRVRQEILLLCEKWMQSFFKDLHIDGPGFELERERFWKGTMKEIKACASGEAF